MTDPRTLFQFVGWGEPTTSIWCLCGRMDLVDDDVTVCEWCLTPYHCTDHICP